MTRVHMPCPGGCGSRWYWVAVIIVAGVRSAARECPACGWSEVKPAAPELRRSE